MNETFQVISFFALVVAIAGSLWWVARDAKQRGRSSINIVLLCLLTWPLGFLFWRALRPPAGAEN